MWKYEIKFDVDSNTLLNCVLPNGTQIDLRNYSLTLEKSVKNKQKPVKQKIAENVTLI